ncbi:MAG: OsmC family protein [Pseudomonadota bacterium]|nr:OsmC family protein [Pseudomonadota bacterium]
MPTRSSRAEWRGTLREGQGTVVVGRDAFTGRYSFPSRFESGDGTNPEELLGASHAACFSMALAAGLGRAGHKPESVATNANVTLDRVGDGFAVTRIDLDCVARVPGLSDADFQRFAEEAKQGCPISKALAGTTISLMARLESTAPLES